MVVRAPIFFASYNLFNIVAILLATLFNIVDILATFNNVAILLATFNIVAIIATFAILLIFFL
jgi:hypothetical protein